MTDERVAADAQRLRHTEQLRQRSEQLRHQAVAARRHLESSTAGTLWRRLDALDFMSQAMTLAAILLLTALPFFIVFSALVGRNFSAALSRHLGLSQQAATIVERLFGPAAETSTTVTAFGVAFLVLGILGAASSVQALYERVFGLEHRGLRDALRLVAWVGALVGWVAAMSAIGPLLRGLWSGQVFLGLVSFAGTALFFWWTMWVLLGGRIRWRDLLPSAVATSVCWVGLGLFSSFFFSQAIVSNSRQYGEIGVIFVLMSWLIAIGVVLVLGAVAGALWRERGVVTSELLGRLRRRRARG